MRGFATSALAQGDEDGERRTSENLHLDFLSRRDNQTLNPGLIQPVFKTAGLVKEVIIRRLAQY